MLITVLRGLFTTQMEYTSFTLTVIYKSRPKTLEDNNVSFEKGNKLWKPYGFIFHLDSQPTLFKVTQGISLNYFRQQLVIFQLH